MQQTDLKICIHWSISKNPKIKGRSIFVYINNKIYIIQKCQMETTNGGNLLQSMKVL